MFASAEVGITVTGKVVAGADVLIEDDAQAESNMAMNINKNENVFISSPRV
jgi:flagellar basal body P-ring protein FlgI